MHVTYIGQEVQCVSECMCMSCVSYMCARTSVWHAMMTRRCVEQRGASVFRSEISQTYVVLINNYNTVYLYRLHVGRAGAYVPSVRITDVAVSRSSS